MSIFIVIKLAGSDVKEWLEFCANMFNTIDPNSTKEQDLINRDFPTFNFDVLDGVEYEIDVTKVLCCNIKKLTHLTYCHNPFHIYSPLSYFHQLYK